MPEAKLHETGGGLIPVTEGWFVVNARDTWWGVAGHFERPPSWDVLPWTE